MMKIGTFRKMSLIEVPGHISAVVFVNNCNMRCSYCHNSWLLDNTIQVPEQDLFSFLDRRQGQLDYVSVTGGEPTLQKDLPEFLEKIKNLGFKTALETNGTDPKMISDLLNKKLIDYIAMDIKTDKKNYSDFFQDVSKINNSIESILNSEINYEFRTTMVPDFIDKIKFKNILTWIRGAENYYLQQFRNKSVLDKSFENKQPYTKKELEEFQKMTVPYVENCYLRI